MALRTSLTSAPTRFAYTGCFTTEKRQARGDGITVYATDAGEWRAIQHLPGLINPSYLILGAGGRTLYSVHGDQDYASAFARDAGTGLLTPRGRAACGGGNVVHGALDPAGRYFVLANYAAGSVAVVPVGADGSLSDFTQRVAMPGAHGTHRSDQTGSHPHQVVFAPDGRFAVVPDKGNDCVSVFAFDAARGELELAHAIPSRPGAGPRHGAFHPALPVYWVLNELDSSITTFRWSPESGGLEPLQVLPTLPTDFFGASAAAAIVVAPDGRTVYASNRGHDSVAVFASDPATGLLRSVAWTPAPGREPRFMALHQGQLYVASEKDDLIGRFDIDPATGALQDAGRVALTPSPVSIVFA